MKRLFLIAPHFPPSALPPSQRVRLMMPYWRRLGFEVTVFTVAHRFREELADPWMSELAGADFRLVELPALPPQLTRRFGIGDLGIRAIPFLLPRLLIETAKVKPDFILWPVPPWYLLTVAPLVGALTRIRYGIDYIDPWVEVDTKPVTVKQRVSQALARVFEGFATRRASVVYAVSEGILEGMRSRYDLERVPTRAIAYGVEFADYRLPIPKKREEDADEILVRYLGALTPDAMRPLGQVLRAFGDLKRDFPLRIEFYGTTYAGGKGIGNQTDEIRDRYGLQECLFEFPKRVSYRKAVELTLGADILFLIGNMLPYYAASKLMGMIASERPFLAFLHRQSSPFALLHRLKYPYLVGYSGDEDDGPEDAYPNLVKTFRELIEKRDSYQPVDCEDPLVAERSALGMTKQFAEPIWELLEGKKSHD